MPDDRRLTRRALLALLPGATLLAACEADGRLSYSVLQTCLRVTERGDHLFRTADEWNAFKARYRGAATDGAEVDFTRQVIVAHFDGPGSACTGFTVEAVEAKEGALEVAATRLLSPDPCIAVLAYPQVVLAVERRELAPRFRIRDASGTLTGLVSCR